MNFASWNVRRLNKLFHQKEVTNFISGNMSFVALLETEVKQQIVTPSLRTFLEINVGCVVIMFTIMIEYGSVGVVKFGMFSIVVFIENNVSFMITFIYPYNDDCYETLTGITSSYHHFSFLVHNSRF